MVGHAAMDDVLADNSWFNLQLPNQQVEPDNECAIESTTNAATDQEALMSAMGRKRTLGGKPKQETDVIQ